MLIVANNSEIGSCLVCIKQFPGVEIWLLMLGGVVLAKSWVHIYVFHLYSDNAFHSSPRQALCRHVILNLRPHRHSSRYAIRTVTLAIVCRVTCPSLFNGSPSSYSLTHLLDNYHTVRRRNCCKNSATRNQTTTSRTKAT